MANKVTEGLDLHPWIRTIGSVATLLSMMVVILFFVFSVKALGESNKKELEAIKSSNNELRVEVDNNRDSIATIDKNTAVTRSVVESIADDIKEIKNEK